MQTCGDAKVGAIKVCADKKVYHCTACDGCTCSDHLSRLLPLFVVVVVVVVAVAVERAMVVNIMKGTVDWQLN